MPKLTGAAKAEFLKRMHAGRVKADADARSILPRSKRWRTKAKPATSKNAGRYSKRKTKKAIKKLAARGGGSLVPFNKKLKPRRNRANSSRAAAIKAIARKFQQARTYRGKKNPEEADMTAAAAMYEQFHGREAERIIEHDEQHAYRSELAELGNLLELKFKIPGGHVLLDDFGKSCQVACTPDGLNIYFVGGRQTVNLDQIEIESDKDYVELGECTLIRYFTKKGFHNFDPINYWHRFGEEDGIKPMLAYDAQNEKLFLIGGNYQARPEGIVN